VAQLRSGRHSANFVIHDDYLEWQFEDSSDADRFADCGRFEFDGKRGYDSHIGWNLASSGRDQPESWSQIAKRFLPAGWVTCDRTLYGRDVGLDRDELESLCKLLNQLREEAMAHR
jgi:hypothetical protein